MCIDGPKDSIHDACTIMKIIFFSFPRLHDDLEPYTQKVEDSYARLGKYLIDMKLDHQNGKKESESLNQFLNLNQCFDPTGFYGLNIKHLIGNLTVPIVPT